MDNNELSTNLASLGTDCISREQAINAFNTNIDELVVAGKENTDAVERYLNRVIDEIKQLPPIQPEKDKVSDLLYHIYSIESPHLDMNGVIAKKYYCEELWKELFGKESELPGWMT